ncbi:MAG: WbqC family protein [Anaerolineales bacterium]|nr:MAG: WbqC family protein [Anaerolineales bacterium]
MGKIVAIHQPNFFPWLGYFNKIARADVFILLDNVQFPKTGGTWINRVQLAVHGEPTWVTVPIKRAYHGTRLICEIEINDGIPWRTKFLKTLQSNYGRAPFFSDVYPVIASLVEQASESLSEFNISAIKALMEKFGLETAKLVTGSSLAGEGNATQLLINMTKKAGGTAYLAGGGAAGYQEDGLFASEGVDLIYQNFRHPRYPQFNMSDFIPGLSILDALMNCGFSKTGLLIGRVADPERLQFKTEN